MLRIRSWYDFGWFQVGDADNNLNEDGLAMRICRLCMETLQRICNRKLQLNGKNTSRGLHQQLENELEKLYLWSENFGPCLLDKTLDYAVDLR